VVVFGGLASRLSRLPRKHLYPLPTTRQRLVPASIPRHTRAVRSPLPQCRSLSPHPAPPSPSPRKGTPKSAHDVASLRYQQECSGQSVAVQGGSHGRKHATLNACGVVTRVALHTVSHTQRPFGALRRLACLSTPLILQYSTFAPHQLCVGHPFSVRIHATAGPRELTPARARSSSVHRGLASRRRAAVSLTAPRAAKVSAGRQQKVGPGGLDCIPIARHRMPMI